MSFIYSIPGVWYVQSKLNQLTSFVSPPPSRRVDGLKAKILVVHCNPVAESFTAAIVKAFSDSAASSGHEVQSISLYEHPDDPAKCFRPNMSCSERKQYCLVFQNPEYDPMKSVEPEIKSYLDLVLWCDSIVFIYPTWWMSLPASLKGFFDRTFVPGVTWEIPSQSNPATVLDMGAKLKNIQRIIGISTYGSSPTVVALAGDGGRSLISNTFRHSVCPKASVLWMGLYAIDKTTREQREAFLKKVSDIPKGI
jgi:NAD(P)H dehydrogenase (quinone)